MFHNQNDKVIVIKDILYEKDGAIDEISPAINFSIPNIDINDYLAQNIFNLNNILGINKEKAIKSIRNIKLLLQVSKISNDIFGIENFIQVLLKAFLESDEIELKHDILDLIEFMIQSDQNILGFILTKTNFIQDNLSKFANIQTLDEKIQFIHFLLSISITENKEIINFFTKYKLIEFICLELQEFSTVAYDQQDPQILSVLDYIINVLFHFISNIQLLSNIQAHFILSSFSLVIENKDEFYFFDLYVDDIISALTKSIKLINPSSLFDSGLFNQLLLNLYTIERCKFEKKLILTFFTEFVDANSSNDFLPKFLENFDFRTVCQSFISLNDSSLYCYYFDFFKLLIQMKPIFSEILFQINFVNFFLSNANDLSFKSKISFWSLITTIIACFPSTNVQRLLNNQNVIINLFEFLRIADKSFLISHLNYLMRPLTFTSQAYKYYQSCLNDFICYLFDAEPEIYDNIQIFVKL